METTNHPLFNASTYWYRELPNRTVVAPMSRVSATDKGLATSEMVDYYTSFATGGFSVVITEGIYTDQYSSQSYNNQPGLVTIAQTKSWEKVTASVHRSPVLIFAQLMHGGALSQSLATTLAPSSVRPAGTKMAAFGGEGGFSTPLAMTLNDIDIAKQGFVNAAINACNAGFDGVEIHGANGYLIDQFLTPELNLRNDQYGGSMKNRYRFVAEIISEIRSAVPQSFIIGLRVSEGKVNDLTYRWEKGALAAKELAEEIKISKPDFIHVAVQTGEWVRDSFYEDGTSLASVLKDTTRIPIIANGGFHNLDTANQALNEGHADLLSIGKAALADPNWPSKTIANVPTIPFHRNMLWPEATLSHRQKIISREEQAL